MCFMYSFCQRLTLQVVKNPIEHLVIKQVLRAICSTLKTALKTGTLKKYWTANTHLIFLQTRSHTTSPGLAVWSVCFLASHPDVYTAIHTSLYISSIHTLLAHHNFWTYTMKLMSGTWVLLWIYFIRTCITHTIV